jgi:hypothetical protein
MTWIQSVGQGKGNVVVCDESRENEIDGSFRVSVIDDCFRVNEIDDCENWIGIDD